MLTDTMRQHFYVACLQGVGFLLEAMLCGPRQYERAAESYDSARHKLRVALNFLGERPEADGSGQPPILASEVQASCVNLVSMAGDALNPGRPTPQDTAFLGVVGPLYGYACAGASQPHQSKT